MKSGGYFQVPEVLEINIYLQRENFKRGKWKNGITLIKHHTYEILQLFKLRYELDIQNSRQVSTFPLPI